MSQLSVTIPNAGSCSSTELLGNRRVLLVIPHADATDVGEAWSGFQWAKGLSSRCEATIVTCPKPGRVPLSRQLPEARVIEFPDVRLPASWERFGSMLKPGYPVFFRQVRQWMREARRRGERFDLVHQIGPLALRYPSPLWDSRCPFIMGPVGGGLETPACFLSEMGTEPWYVRFRRFDEVRMRVDPWLRRTYERASVVIGVAPYVKAILDRCRIPVRRFEIMSETGILHEPQPPARTASPQLRLLYVGRVIRTKGLRDAIRALGLLRDRPDWVLTAIGDGPDLSACRHEAESLGIANRVQFLGKQPRSEVESRYRESDVFVFPSFREPSGNVVFEALTHGLPVITSDRGGPGHVVKAQCGFTIPVESPEQYARDIAKAISTLMDQREMLQALSSAASPHVRELALWANKINRMGALYEDVLQSCPVNQRGVLGGQR